MLQIGCLQRWMNKAGLCLLMGLLLGSTACAVTWAQDVGGYYSNRRVFSGFVEYSNDSSHMLLGYADGRKISAMGASLERRSFLSNHLSGRGWPRCGPHDRNRSYNDRLQVTVSATACVFGNGQFHFAGSGGYAGNQHTLECDSGNPEPGLCRHRNLHRRNAVDLRKRL
jgi:hypothetical protein